MAATASWSELVSRYLRGLEHVSPLKVDLAEQWAANASMFGSTASWRLKVRLRGDEQAGGGAARAPGGG